MTRKSDLLQRLSNEPLITDFVPGAELENSAGCYLGIGLSNKNGLTEHLPFDALGLVLAAELVRDRAELGRATILIADEHAATGPNDRASIERVSRSRRDFAHKLLERMGFDEFDIILGSEMQRDAVPDFRGNEYERLQIADMESFRRAGNGVKIGWKHSTMEFDERRFDSIYTRIFGPLTSFVYTEPGRSLDGSAVPPYLCTAKPRLLFLEGEDIGYKVDQMTKGTRAYFIRILDLYDKLVCGHPGNGRNCPDKLKRRLREVYSTVYGKAWN